MRKTIEKLSKWVLVIGLLLGLGYSILPLLSTPAYAANCTPAECDSIRSFLAAWCPSHQHGSLTHLWCPETGHPNEYLGLCQDNTFYGPAPC
jgi:hypothetical protein